MPTVTAKHRSAFWQGFHSAFDLSGESAKLVWKKGTEWDYPAQFSLPTTPLELQWKTLMGPYYFTIAQPLAVPYDQLGLDEDWMNLSEDLAKVIVQMEQSDPLMKATTDQVLKDCLAAMRAA